MVVCTLIVANLSGWFLMNRAKTMLLEQCKQNAGSSAKIAAQRIDGDLLEQLQAGDEGSADYEEILSQLQEFLCGDEIKYIYTMRMNGDTLEFIVDAEPRRARRSEKHTRFMTKSRKHSMEMSP